MHPQNSLSLWKYNLKCQWFLTDDHISGEKQLRFKKRKSQAYMYFTHGMSEFGLIVQT